MIGDRMDEEHNDEMMNEYLINRRKQINDLATRIQAQIHETNELAANNLQVVVQTPSIEHYVETDDI